MNTLSLRSPQCLLPWLALLVAILAGYQQVAAQLADSSSAAELVVAGSYAGSVVINEPAPLGDLDLLLEISSANGQLTGQVNPAKTQVFLGGPTFTGSVTTGGVVTPTLHIESQIFRSLVSGRTVQRHFALSGEVLNNGDTLRGNYTETIVGFKPHPMLVKGTFLLVRPAGVTKIVPVPTPKGSTPTPTPIGGPVATHTPTATPQPGPGNGNAKFVYLPVVMKK